ncbi:MAG: fluoride efflux transporter CrcB [Candidatus Caenarcaniphilales bacterium]|nr:fluoride efflux transporter CrcB [Candidatus Caenarcaniphilales bacterium]
MITFHSLKTPILISLGAICGSLSRHYIGWYFQPFEKMFPFGTFLVNISGCFLVGLFVGLTVASGFPKLDEFRMFFVVGFLGSYTTFSAYALQTLLLTKNHHYPQALLYCLTTPVCCLVAVFAGYFIAKAIKGLFT